jgi:hypothetical protein
MPSASDTIQRRKKRVLYADRVIQETVFNKGWKNHIVLEGGNFGGAMTYPPYYNMRDGTLVTTPEERQSYVDSVPDKITATAPGVPTGVSATIGNAQAAVSFTAPANNGGATITSYTVTSSPGGFTATGSSSPVTVTGLTNGVAYTFTVVATNSAGSSESSDPSSPVTPSTVPGAPTDVSATAGNAQAAVSFTAPANNGGAAITSYTVTSSPGGFTATGSSSPITVTGLTNGVAYTFTVIATNTNGSSSSSASSGAVTPVSLTPGMVSWVASLYDDANLGYTNLQNTVSKMCTDSAANMIVGGYNRTGTFTINKPDTDGITQVSVLSETFEGANSFTQSSTTYYTNNLYVTKYSPSGVPQWAAAIGGDTNKANTMYGVACDSSNNVYALVAHGISIVTYYNADGSTFGTLNNTFAFGNSIPGRVCLIKYNSAGQIQWINTITAGDSNNQYVLIISGSVIVDDADNILVSCQSQRAGGGSGATVVKLYKYTGIAAGELQYTQITQDSYTFGSDYHRGYLIKMDGSGTYSWVARMAMPTAWGENNGGTVNVNMVTDASNNVYLCLNGQNSSSPICNIYGGVATTSNPLPFASPYYRIDLRGNSISPALPQYYRFVAIVKFDSSGAYQGLATAHQLTNGSVSLNMNPSIGINKATNTLYMTLNAQGFVGTNATSGAQLNQLYVDSFSANNANGSNYDILVTNTFNMTLAQPQTVLAVLKYNTSLVAQSMSYIDTPEGNTGSVVSIDPTGNVYVATTIKGVTDRKNIYTFSSIASAEASFIAFGSVAASNANNDGLLVSYSDDLTTGRWATTVSSSDGLNESGFVSTTDSSGYVYFGCTSSLNSSAGSNTIAINEYDGVAEGDVQNTLFGNLDVTNATDRAGVIIKYS